LILPLGLFPLSPISSLDFTIVNVQM
jgi:hypothetical protein